MEEKRSFTGPIVAAILLLLPCLYVGAYVATVRRGFAWMNSSFTYHNIDWVAHYQINGKDYNDALCPLFSPIHQIDRWLRPSYWKFDPERIGFDFDFNIDTDDDGSESASTSVDVEVDSLPAPP